MKEQIKVLKDREKGRVAEVISDLAMESLSLWHTVHMGKFEVIILKLRNEVESKDLLNKNLNADLAENRNSI